MKAKLKTVLPHYQAELCLEWKAEHTEAVRDVGIQAGMERDGNSQWISGQTGNTPFLMPMSVSAPVLGAQERQGRGQNDKAAPTGVRNHNEEEPHRVHIHTWNKT